MLARWQAGEPAPEIWFSYHSYYKAPDLLGPAIAGRLGIPYVVAEASDAERRATGEWARHRKPPPGPRRRRPAFFFSPSGTGRASNPGARSIALCSNCRPSSPSTGAPPQSRPNAIPRLVTVAMMREGTKQNSYLTLARILASVADRPWTLTIIGDGRKRAEIAAAFAGLPPGRVDWRGADPHHRVVAELAAHDLFIWPGVREAYGLVYLEAQAVGLPIVAFDSGGVSATVRNGETALLASEGDEPALAQRSSAWPTTPRGSAGRGRRRARFALEERNPARAAAILEHGLALAIANHAARSRPTTGGPAA